MKQFSNQFIKKEFNKKLLPLIIGLVLILITIILGVIRENIVEKKLEEAKNLHETIIMSNNAERSSYVTINYYPYVFADYSDDKDNAYYIVADNTYFYIVFMNRKEAENLTEEQLKQGYLLKGTTQNTPYDVKELAVNAFNEWYEDVEDFKPMSVLDFDNRFGNIYLDTTKTKYALTTDYNAIIVLLGIVGFIAFVNGMYRTVSYRRRLRKLTSEEIMLIDSEMNSSNAKFYQKADLCLTDNYLIDFHKFNYYNYKDIKWVYTYIQRTNGIKSNEQLVIVTKDHKKHFIASTSGSKKMQPIYEEIYTTLTNKNKDVRVGYTSENIKINQEEIKGK